MYFIACNLYQLYLNRISFDKLIDRIILIYSVHITVVSILLQKKKIVATVRRLAEVVIEEEQARSKDTYANVSFERGKGREGKIDLCWIARHRRVRVTPAGKGD